MRGASLAWACERARKHVESCPTPHPDYRIGYSTIRQLKNGWYFDYTIKPVQDIPVEEWEQFGGAPGFFISRDTTQTDVQIVSCEEYREMKIAEAEIVDSTS